MLISCSTQIRRIETCRIRLVRRMHDWRCKPPTLLSLSPLPISLAQSGNYFATTSATWKQHLQRCCVCLMAFRRLEFGQLTAQSYCRWGKYLLGRQRQANGKWPKGATQVKGGRGARAIERRARKQREQRRGSREVEEAEKKRQQFKKGATKTSSGLFAQSLWIAN